MFKKKKLKMIFKNKNVFSRIMRLAIVDKDRCKPTKCAKECIAKCPSNASGKVCVELDIEDTKKAKISEQHCIGCGICEKVCPFHAISIVNIPVEVKNDLSFRYSKNGFCLYRLPSLKPNLILGIIGENGIGKSTIVKILSKELNISEFPYKIDKSLIKIFESIRNIAVKPQHIDSDDQISGGEMQMKAIKQTIATEADMYIFDEPSNFLDVKQRLHAADLISSLKKENKFVLVIDHDLNFMDYCCDYISLMFGKPACYGIISNRAFPSAEAINYYLNGYLPNENIKFRKESFSYNRSLQGDLSGVEIPESKSDLMYPAMKIQNNKNFKLITTEGKIPINCSITVILGENGVGKTTFIKNLKDHIGVSISVKNQYPKFGLIKEKQTVKSFLEKYAARTFTDEIFKIDVVKAFGIEMLMNKYVNHLSGGEQQRLAIITCLAQDRELYILDEPSALLDIQQRINFTKAIKRFILHNQKAAIIIEHDISMALAIGKELHSQMIVFEKKEKECVSSGIMTVKDAMNKFLEILDITFRLDQKYKTHRTNKKNSVKDTEQRKCKQFFVD